MTQSPDFIRWLLEHPSFSPALQNCRLLRRWWRWYSLASNGHVCEQLFRRCPARKWKRWESCVRPFCHAAVKYVAVRAVVQTKFRDALNLASQDRMLCALLQIRRMRLRAYGRTVANSTTSRRSYADYCFLCRLLPVVTSHLLRPQATVSTSQHRVAVVESLWCGSELWRRLLNCSKTFDTGSLLFDIH